MSRSRRTIKPSRPTTTRSASTGAGSSVRSDSTEISRARDGSSSRLTGAKRGSSRAAATAISRTTAPSSRSAAMWPMQPRSAPRSVRVTKAPRFSAAPGTAHTGGSGRPSRCASSVARASPSSAARSPGGWYTRGTAARTRSPGSARAGMSAGRGSTSARRTATRRPGAPPRRRSQRPRPGRPAPSAPSSRRAARTSTALPLRRARRGASPQALPRGFAPGPSLPVPRPACSGAVARGTRHRPRGAPRPARGPPRRYGSASGIHPSQPVHRRHTIDRDDVGGDAGVHLVLLRRHRDFVEGAHHDALEAPVHGVLVPEVAAAVLHPLEVAHGHAAGVREDVGNDEDALLLEDLVGGGGGGTVRALADDLRLDLRGVLTGDDVLGGGRDQH